MDSQSHMTEDFGYKYNSIERSVYDVLMEQSSVADVLLNRADGIHVVHATPGLIKA